MRIGQIWTVMIGLALGCLSAGQTAAQTSCDQVDWRDNPVPCVLEWDKDDRTFRLRYDPEGDTADDGAPWTLDGSGVTKTAFFNQGSVGAPRLDDLDGDGWPDLWILSLRGMVDALYFVHRYDPHTQAFVGLGEVQGETSLDSDGLIVSSGRSGCCAWVYNFFSFAENALAPEFRITVRPFDAPRAQNETVCDISTLSGTLRAYGETGRDPSAQLASTALRRAYCSHYTEGGLDEIMARLSADDVTLSWTAFDRCVAAAQDGQPRDLRDCMFVHTQTCAVDTPTTSGIARCALEEVGLWDDMLNEAYGALRAADVPPDFRDGLQEAQRAWIALRDKDCEAFTALGLTYAPEERARANCLLQHTTERVVILRQLQDDVAALAN